MLRLDSISRARNQDLNQGEDRPVLTVDEVGIRTSVGLLMLVVLSCGGTAARPTASVAPTVSLPTPTVFIPYTPPTAVPKDWAMALAQLQDPGVVVDTQPLVGQFRQQLGLLNTHCDISDEGASDSIVTAQTYLRDRGVTETLLSILRNWNNSFPSGLPKMNETRCDEMLTIWMYLRQSTRS